MPNGLGRYVIFLPNSYVIHSPPPPDSPLQGPKPGSFMVPEADLAAIWPRITNADEGLHLLMKRWIGFLGSWALLVLALGLAAFAIAGESDQHPR